MPSIDTAANDTMAFEIVAVSPKQCLYF
jgi:hypothetical protein